MSADGSHSVRLLYFAWLRERVGRAEEDVALPQGVATVADVVAWLKSRGPEFVEAFAKPEVVRAAVDKRHVKSAAPIAGAREIAFFLRSPEASHGGADTARGF